MFEADGDKNKNASYSAIDADGSKVNMSDSIPWDGKPHQVTGPKGAPPAMVMVKHINERTTDVTVTVNGQGSSSAGVPWSLKTGRR